MFQERQIIVLFLSRQLRISNKISTPVIYNGRKETIKRRLRIWQIQQNKAIDG